MSLKLICIIIYNGCFDHVCSWNYNAYITVLCKLHFQHQLHLYIISHATGLSILCVVSLCTVPQTAGSWENLGRHYQGKYCYRCAPFLCSFSKHPALASDGGELYLNTDGLFCVLYDSAITLAKLLYCIDPIQQ